MSIRETLNRNPAITTGGTLLIVIVAVGFIIYSQMSGGPRTSISQYYFTTDDGKTWFADDAKKLPPFDKDGKPAVRAYVFRCKGEDAFVAYMERYSDESKKKLEAIAAKGDGGTSPMIMGSVDVEFKKPNDVKWLKVSENPQAYGMAMSIIKCKDANETPERVLP